MALAGQAAIVLRGQVELLKGGAHAAVVDEHATVDRLEVIAHRLSLTAAHAPSPRAPRLPPALACHSPCPFRARRWRLRPTPAYPLPDLPLRQSSSGCGHLHKSVQSDLVHGSLHPCLGGGSLGQAIASQGGRTGA